MGTRGQHEDDRDAPTPAGDLKPLDRERAMRHLRAHHAAVTAKEKERGERMFRPRGHVHVATVDSATWQQIVDVSGSGRLTSLAVSGGPRYHEFQVEIDGKEVVADRLAGTGVDGHVNNGIALDLPFYERFVVRARDEETPSPLPRYWVAWVSDSVKEVGQEQEVRKIEGIEYRIRIVHYRDEANAELRAETLLGPRRLSEVRLTRDWVGLERPEIDFPRSTLLDGFVVLRDLVEGTEEQAGDAKVTIYPSGRRSPVGEIVLEGERPRPVRLPGPGEYLAVADVAGHANVPSFFAAL